jgi:hypothetical protein
LNNASFNGTASQLILKVLALALPHNGTPAPVRFDWSNDSSGSQFAVSAVTNAGFSISVVSVDYSHANANSDDEDDV